jgi:hypothetical protein
MVTYVDEMVVAVVEGVGVWWPRGCLLYSVEVPVGYWHDLGFR